MKTISEITQIKDAQKDFCVGDIMIGIDNYEGVIVMVTNFRVDHKNKTFSGACLNKCLANTGAFRIGEHYTGWDKDKFVPFLGEIKLISNV